MEGVGGHLILFSRRLGFFPGGARRVWRVLASCPDAVILGPTNSRSTPLSLTRNPRGFFISIYKMNLFWRVSKLESGNHSITRSSRVDNLLRMCIALCHYGNRHDRNATYHTAPLASTSRVSPSVESSILSGIIKLSYLVSANDNRTIQQYSPSMRVPSLYF